MVTFSEGWQVEAKSAKDCALKTNDDHVGFIYDRFDNTCHLLTCVNPDVHYGLFDNRTEVYYLEPLVVNHLLARGQYMYIDIYIKLQIIHFLYI